jgi:voltage-gated potassium channel
VSGPTADEPAAEPRRALPRLRLRLYELLEDEDAAAAPARRVVRSCLTLVILLGVAVAVLDTVEPIRAEWAPWLAATETACVALFTIEYAARIWCAVEDRAGRYEHPVRGRLRYALTPMAIIDLLAVLPHYLTLLLPLDLVLLRTLRLLRVLKITRHSPAAAMIELVIVNQRRSLLAAAAVLGVVLLLASGLMYHAERAAQPDAFGSIPAAMWWAVATLTTVGYGDVTPVTPLGRVIAGVAATLGIAMFALPTAILGAGFLQEVQKRDFAAAAAMVARAPLFRHLDPPQLAELTALLRPRSLPPRYTVTRPGEHGDAMYFIDEGEVVVRARGGRHVLGPGSFFGELALLEGRPRSATVTTLTACRLLELGAGDFHRLLAGDERLRAALVGEARRRLGDEEPGRP